MRTTLVWSLVSLLSESPHCGVALELTVYDILTFSSLATYMDIKSVISVFLLSFTF